MKKATAALFLLLFSFMLISNYNSAAIRSTVGDTLNVEKVSIDADGYTLSGMLYVPSDVQPGDPKPAVVCAHGLTNAKETMSGFALEIARRGMVALSLDLAGHGQSGGKLEGDDPSLGVSSALAYLKSLDYVDPERLGLVGHSLGAGAAIAASDTQGISAVVLIAGGVDVESGGTGYPPLSATFPPNMLVIIGQLDILFDVEKVKIDLEDAFNTEVPVVPEMYYGSAADGTARQLLLPSTIHLLEPIEPLIIEKAASWMRQHLQAEGSTPPDPLIVNNILVTANMVALFALIWINIPVAALAQGFLRDKGEKPVSGVLPDLWAFLVWGGLGLLLFLPISGLGNLIPFPPLRIGSSMAWWLLLSGVGGLIILYIVQKRAPHLALDLIQIIKKSFKLKDTLTAFGMFLLLYAIVYIGESYLGVTLTFIIPLFRTLTFRRLSVFTIFIPFFGVYFIAEGLYFHQLRIQKADEPGFKNLIRTIALKVAPYFWLIIIQYGAMIMFERRVFTGMVGFLIEFLLAIIPIFMITIAHSWWFHRITRRIGMGVVFNTLLLSWISAGLFPF